MTISVVIPTMNRAQDLKNALESIMRQTMLPTEVIVVDQSVDGRTKQVISEMAARYTAIHFEYAYQKEKSTVKARNRGIALAKSDVVCFIDDDIVLFEDYFEQINRYFEENPAVGGLMGNVVVDRELKGLKWELRKFMLRLFLINNFDAKMTVSGFGYPVYEREVHVPMRVELLSGYSMNFRRHLLENEKFDEWFSGYSYREDVDLSYRLSRKTKLMIVPQVRFYHRSSSANRLNLEALKRMEVKNSYYVFRKYKYRNFLSNFLFVYSLSGLIFIDLIEFLTSFQQSKFVKFKAGILSLIALIFKKENISVKSTC
jgi:glycosyltransferase involved in cell wall biosynthesis